MDYNKTLASLSLEDTTSNRQPSPSFTDATPRTINNIRPPLPFPPPKLPPHLPNGQPLNQAGYHSSLTRSKSQPLSRSSLRNRPALNLTQLGSSKKATETPFSNLSKYV